MKSKEVLWLVIIMGALLGLTAGLYSMAKPREQNKSFKPLLPEGVSIALEGKSRITSSQAGRIQWTMTSEGLAFHPGKEIVMVEKPRTWIPLAEGGTVEVLGDSGKYFKPTEDVLLQDQVRVAMERQGRREWVVFGDTASYHRKEEAFYIGEMKASLFPATGDSVRITARNGRYDIVSRTMTATQDVSCVYSQGMTLVTEEINFNIDTNIASTDKEVEIKGNGFLLRGSGLDADLKTRQVTVPRNVRLRLEKGRGGKK